MPEINNLSLKDTVVAFRSKSDKELKHMHFLFRMMNLKFLVKTGTILLKTALTLRLPVGPIIKATFFKHFCGGESLDKCDSAIERLHRYKIGAILDYSVEGKKTEKDFVRVSEEIIKTILKAKGNNKIPFTVFKISGIASVKLLEKVSRKEKLSEAELVQYETARARINNICNAAYEHKVRILIDAEESWIQKAIDKIAEEMMEKYNRDQAIVYTTLQMYRHDRVEYLSELYSRAVIKDYRLGIKLVRGAYMEKENDRAKSHKYISPVHFAKDATDIDYNIALRFCMKHVNRIALCAGTHNEESILLLVQLMDEIRLKPGHPHVFFSQLYGMADHLSYNLAKAGYNVAKYVPYGPVRDTVPYLIRRAEENTAMLGQMSRELTLIKTEIERRKNDLKI